MAKNVSYRFSSFVLVMLAFGLLLEGSALAQTVVVLEPSDDKVTLTDGDGGTSTGSFTVTNLSKEPLPLTVKAIDAGTSCVITPKPTSVPGARRTDVTLSADDCEIGKGSKAQVSFTGTDITPADLQLTVKKAEPVVINDILKFFAYALPVVLLCLFVFVWSGRPNKRDGTKVGWSDDVAPASAGWSFKDSWVSNVTVISTAFAVLLGTSELLETILGESPDVALGRMIVAGAISAFLVATAPLLLKVLGKTEAPTVGGLLLGALVTVTAAVGQLLVFAWAIDKLEIGWLGSPISYILAGAGGLLVVVYACRSLARLVGDAYPEPEPKTSDVQKAADKIAVAILAADEPINNRIPAMAEMLNASDYPIVPASPLSSPRRNIIRSGVL